MTPVVVFIHGFPNGPKLWEQQVAHFTPTCHTACLDLRELAGGGDYRLANLTQAAATSVKALKGAHPESPLYLVGHDLGCFVVDEVSRQMPQTVAGQVLLNGTSLAAFASRLTSLQQIRRSYYVALLNLPLVRQAIRRWLVGFCSRFAYDLANVPSNSPLRRLAEQHFAAIEAYPLLAREALARLWSRSKTEVTPVRTLLVSAIHDPFLIEPSLLELRSFFSQATLARVDASHWMPATHSLEINRLLTTIIFPEENGA